MLRAQGRLPPPPAPRECRHRSPRAHGDIDIATDAGLTSRLPLAGLMPDQIALDKFTAAIVALLFSATAALAQDRLTKQDLVTLAVTLGVYDNRCEKLAPRLLTSPPWTCSLFRPLASTCSMSSSSFDWSAETLSGSRPFFCQPR
jgi:hypothetical protein